jgi:transposase
MKAPTTQLTLPQAIMYYRDVGEAARRVWLLERGFHRFKRGSLPALPIYFKNPDRITGLMFVLNIALRVFTLMEFVVRQTLMETLRTAARFVTGFDPYTKRNCVRVACAKRVITNCELF